MGTAGGRMATLNSDNQLGLVTESASGDPEGYVLGTATTADKLWKEYCQKEPRKPRGPRQGRDWDLVDQASSIPNEEKESTVENRISETRAEGQAARRSRFTRNDMPHGGPHFMLHDRVRGDLGGSMHPHAVYYGRTYEEPACTRSVPGGSYVTNMVAPTTEDNGAVYTKPMQGFSPALQAAYNQVHQKYDEIWQNTQWSKYETCRNGPMF